MPAAARPLCEHPLLNLAVALPLHAASAARDMMAVFQAKVAKPSRLLYALRPTMHQGAFLQGFSSVDEHFTKPIKC